MSYVALARAHESSRVVRSRCSHLNFSHLSDFVPAEWTGAYDALDLLPTAVLLLDDDKRVIYANPAAENLLAMSRKQLVDRTPAELFGDETALTCAIAKAVASGASYTEQELELGLAAHKLHLTCTVTPVGSGAAALAIEFKHIDQQLRVAREERLLEQ